MKVYIVVDGEKELEDMTVFQNKTEAEDYMLNYILETFDPEVLPPTEETKAYIKAYIQDCGYFESVYLIKKEMI